MGTRHCRFTLPACLALACIGLLALTGCAPPGAHRPTLVPLLSLPTTTPATSTATMTPDTRAPSAPTPSLAPRLTVVPSPTTNPLLKKPTATQAANTPPVTDHPQLATGTPPANSQPPHEGAPLTTRRSPLASHWILAYDSDVAGNDELYLVSADGTAPINVTNHPAEDRYPAWSPDGQRVAFQSNRDGNWELYTLDLQEEKLTRLTFHLAYDGAPAWSPDGVWIIFESYRDTSPCQTGTPEPNPPPCPDLELYRIPAAGGRPERLTDSPGGDYQPTWSPDGAWIAFTSWREGDKDVYVVPASGGPARNITATPGDDWSPAWSPDGNELLFLSEREGVAELYRQRLDDNQAVRLTINELPEERPTWWPDGSLLFSRYDPGPPFEAHNPFYPGVYHLYRLSPNGEPPQPILPAAKARHPAAAPRTYPTELVATGGTGKPRSRMVAAGSPPQLALKRLDEIVAPDPRLVAGVDEAFRAWRNAVQARSGHDFLRRVSDIYRPAAYFGHRLGYLSWHKAGRAVDLLFDWLDAGGGNALYVVREDLAGQVYWRLFLKCTAQDGSLGEPLTQGPWYFWWHTATPGNAAAVPDGGRRLPIPAGYYVDVTALAARFGWSRIASYHLEDFHWQRDSTATEYWHYQYVDGLTWYQAMSQILPQEVLEELFSRPAAEARGQTLEVMDGKGLPSADEP